MLFLLLLTALAPAEVVTNWENGFEVDIPNEWLRRDLGSEGLKLSQDRVRMQVGLETKKTASPPWADAT